MVYEKPRILDLSDQPTKGSGKGCATGSGDTICELGNTAEWCYEGSGGGGVPDSG